MVDQVQLSIILSTDVSTRLSREGLIESLEQSAQRICGSRSKNQALALLLARSAGGWSWIRPHR